MSRLSFGIEMKRETLQDASEAVAASLSSWHAAGRGLGRGTWRRILHGRGDGMHAECQPLMQAHVGDFALAAALLLDNLHDAEVQEFLTRDLQAALQTGERRSFPAALRREEHLWGLLEELYSQQQ
ncbi:unnamed protein product, partial [Effrenium voratum]